MYPHERSLVKQLSGLPFEIVGVNSDDDLDELKEVLKKENITWRSFQNERDGKPAISEEWVVQGWPTIYIIDHERCHSVSRTSVAIVWIKQLLNLLAEMGHDVEITHEEEGEEDEADGETP